MSRRKPTIDGIDDTDDEDGAVLEERAQDTDLTLHRRHADDLTPDAARRAGMEDEGRDRPEQP